MSAGFFILSGFISTFLGIRFLSCHSRATPRLELFSGIIFTIGGIFILATGIALLFIR